MYRQILGYVPSVVIPALISVLMIYVYTRVLTPAAFGCYTYIFSAILVLQASLFFAVPTAVMRFFPRAVIDGRRDGLLKEAYLLFYGMAGATILVSVCAGYLVDLPDDYRPAAQLAVPALLFRSMVQLNQAVNRSCNRMQRFNTIECLHAVSGFGLGLLAVFVFGRGSASIVLGLLIAAVVCSCIDFRSMMSPFRQAAGRLDSKQLVRLAEYAWPLVAAAATEVIMQNSDRFMLGSMAGAEMLGIFAVAYSLVERPTSLICMSISTATFALVLQVLERDGKEAARLQAGRNGIALLALALPACAGLALTADTIAASLVGPAFRQGVAALIPLMSLAALARGVRAHFIEHAFHMSGRPLGMVWTYGPVTVLNIGLNLYAIPRYGMFGAAWTAAGCQILTVICGWIVGTSRFPLWLPPGQVVRCVLAIVPMSVALTVIQFPLNWLGLVAAVLTGAVVYIVSAVVLDVGEVRSLGREALLKRLRSRVPSMSGSRWAA